MTFHEDSEGGVRYCAPVPLVVIDPSPPRPDGHARVSTRYRGRLAPSPSGALHLGIARTALIGWLRARSLGGELHLRIEDIDGPRVRPGAAEAIVEDLRWLGLDFDGPRVVQSERLARYDEVAKMLADRGATFRCTCSRREIASVASAPHSEDGPTYPGTCREGPTHPERPAALRMRMAEPTPSFVDAVVGECSGVGGGDFVLVRKDGVPSYQLACAVDDHDSAITEVLRGDDLIASTARQLAIFDALGWERPTYAHVPLLMDDRGKRLAKRDKARSVRSMRDAGEAAEAIIGRLAHSAGICDAPSARTAASLIDGFDLDALKPTER